MRIISGLCVLTSIFIGSVGCGIPGRRKPEPPPPFAALPAGESAKLTDADYLKRKATLGTRAERLEAIDLIGRMRNPDYLQFLLQRLRKEDDRFLKIHVMYALADLGDIRAVGPLRHIARWDDSRVGIEAVGALYRLGDDSQIPRLIRLLRLKDDSPESAGMAHRSLKKLTGVDLPPRPRVWSTWYRSHRLTPYSEHKWYWPFAEPLPPTVAGTTLSSVRPSEGRKLPAEESRFRRSSMTFYEFWRPDE